jgi:excisionase family DNA binding protein
MKYSDENKIPAKGQLLLRPKQAMYLLNCGHTRLYEMIAAGDIESFLDGGARKISTASVEAYIERKLKEAKEAA